MKAVGTESANIDSIFKQLDNLRVVYEEYIKISKETIPQAEAKSSELNKELDQKTQALDDVIFLLVLSIFQQLC